PGHQTLLLKQLGGTYSIQTFGRSAGQVNPSQSRLRSFAIGSDSRKAGRITPSVEAPARRPTRLKLNSQSYRVLRSAERQQHTRPGTWSSLGGDAHRLCGPGLRSPPRGGDLFASSWQP